jgi:hypothetical protein
MALSVRADDPRYAPLNILKDWIQTIRTDEHFGMGGDDSTYDYDPDMVYVIWQFASTLHQIGIEGAAAAYNEFHTWVTTESGLAETIAGEGLIDHCPRIEN